MLAKDQMDSAWAPDRTVDPREIERFDAMADEWWNPAGKFKPVHAFNDARLGCLIDWIARHFDCNQAGAAPFHAPRVLDVGCGAGLVCEPLAELGADVVGIDATARNVEIARHHAAKSGLEIAYRHCLAGDVARAGEQFDVVLNLEVVEHVADPEQLMRDCCAVVAPGGLLVVATLNRTLRALVTAKFAAEYVLRWLPKGTHDWRRFLAPREIGAMIQGSGLETVETRGVTFNPFRRRWTVSGDASVNYMLLARRQPVSTTDRSADGH